MRMPSVYLAARSVALIATIALAAAVGRAQQAGEPVTAPPGRGGAPVGGAQQGGRGAVRPECVKPKLPAAECNIASAINWNDPPLGDGPFLIQSAVPQHRNLRVVVVAKGLEQPWSAAWLPDGSMLVTERPGRLRIIRPAPAQPGRQASTAPAQPGQQASTAPAQPGQQASTAPAQPGQQASTAVLDPTPIAGVPKVRAAGLQGLQDVALHPRFAENHWVYLSYHKPVPAPTPTSTTPAATNAGAVQPQAPTPQEAGAATLARGTWNGRALVDVRDIFETGATNTESLRIGFGRDGMLYMTVSASGTGPDVLRSADPNDYAGKTIRLRDDGSIPPDNPFVNKPGYKPAIYTLGHRNGHSMQPNPETGQMWVTEQGPNGGDEINVLKPGANYGWPYVSNGRNYMGSRISESPYREGFEQAIVVWVPSIAVTGGTFYTGDKFPGWQRNFFVGGLRQGETPRTGQMQRIEFNDKWEEIRREPMLQELHQRIRDVRQGPDGYLYVLTAENAGAVLRIEPGEPSAPAR